MQPREYIFCGSLLYMNAVFIRFSVLHSFCILVKLNSNCLLCFLEKHTFFQISLVNVLNNNFLPDFLTVLSETFVEGAQGRKAVNLIGLSQQLLQQIKQNMQISPEHLRLIFQSLTVCIPSQKGAYDNQILKDHVLLLQT